MTIIIYSVKRFQNRTGAMKVSREQAAANRERIVDMAARQFREKGFDGIGVADLMKSAGLTHGGFYGHFASKSELAAKACERALQASAAKWKMLAEAGGEDAFAALVANYVSHTHRDRRGTGCVLSSLGSDAARQDGPVRDAVGAGVMALLAVLEEAAPGDTAVEKRQAAQAAMAQMVGAVMLARLVDEPTSGEILDAVHADLTARAGSRSHTE
jgi:TetR/AcrR family transcriptional regulator, transcriptional repressor for nem operon